MAGVYDKQGNYEKAIEWYQKTLEIQEKVLGKEHLYTAKTYNNMAEVYYRQSDHEKALEYYIQAYKILYSVHGEEHPKVIIKENLKMVYDLYYEDDNFEQWLESEIK